MTDHDISVHGRARVGVVDGEDVSIDSPREFVRIRGADLRAVAHRAAAARELHPDRDVLVDIDVVIDMSAAEARTRLATADVNLSGETLGYIGTPVGLAGLITDIHALGICDGAVLRPLLPGVIDLINDRVLGELATMGPDQPLPLDARSA